jgi:hypothetical protein
VLRAVLWRHYGDRRRAEIAAARDPARARTFSTSIQQCQTIGVVFHTTGT